MNNFYRIGSAFRKSVVKVKSKKDYITLDVLKDDCPLIHENEFFVETGSKLFDVIQFSDSFNFAISKRVKEILEKNNVSGWGCFQIKIDGIEDEYFAFQTLGKAGPILNLDALSMLETKNREFDIKSWDGLEVFNLQDSLLTVCTLRVKEILEQIKITNLEILPL